MSDGDRELIAAVGRDLVAAVAPEEMPLFRPMSAAYFDAPHRLEQTPRDDMLGFGVAEVVVALTPVALSVVTEVLGQLRRQAADTAAKHAVGGAEAGVRGLFRRFRPAPETPEASATPAGGLTVAQLAEIGRLAFEKARAMHLSEERARLLSDAMVGSLVRAG